MDCKFSAFEEDESEGKDQLFIFEWVEVLSGVPQGSVLGPLLFLLFVNDLPDWISSNIRMFADDTKIWCIIKEIDDGLMLQSDLGNLVKWSDKWLLKFNTEKCKVMHLGHKLNTQYYMKEEGAILTLATTEEERDFGLISSSSSRVYLPSEKHTCAHQM